MEFEWLLRPILEFFRTFDGAKALQVAYYSVALVVATMGLIKAIRFAESRMPKRLLEFATRYEGRIVEEKLNALKRIHLVPAGKPSGDYIDFSDEIARALKQLDKQDSEGAATSLEALAVRLDEKIGLAEAQLKLTRQQAATTHLLFGSLARKVPQRKDRALVSLRRSVELVPGDPEAHREIGLLYMDAGQYVEARVKFADFGEAAEAMSIELRKDRSLLLIEAQLLTAKCHRAEGYPGRERTTLDNALSLANEITDSELHPHLRKARILELLAENAMTYQPPRVGQAAAFRQSSASEYRLAGHDADANRLSQDAA